MIYLASPYTHKDSNIVKQRYEKTLEIVARLLNYKYLIYSPIVHCHEITTRYNLPIDYLFWKNYNEHFMDLSTELIVYMLEGWEESKGVDYEINYMTKKGKKISYIEE